MLQILNLVNENPAKIRNFDGEFAKQLKFKGTKFPDHKKTMQKLKNKIKFPLACLTMKITHYIVFILQKKLLKSM